MEKNTFAPITILFPVLDKTGQEWRGEDQILNTKKIPSVTIEYDILKKNIEEFANSISSTIDNLALSIKKYDLDSIEVSAAISVTGKISIVSLGGEIGTQGCLKFVFKKKDNL